MAGRIIFVRVLDAYSLLCVSLWCVFTLSLHSITDYDSLFWFHVRQKDLKEEKRGQNEWRMKLCMIYPFFQIKSWLSWVNDCWRVRKQDRTRDEPGKMRRKRLKRRDDDRRLYSTFCCLERLAWLFCTTLSLDTYRLYDAEQVLHEQIDKKDSKGKMVSIAVNTSITCCTSLWVLYQGIKEESHESEL